MDQLDEIRRLHSQLDQRVLDIEYLRQALKGLMSWHLSADYYVKLGFAKGGADLAYRAAEEVLATTK